MCLMYSLSSFGTHHIFFPPRFEVVVGEYLPHGLSTHLGDNPPSHRLFCGQPDRPSCESLRCPTTHHRNNGALSPGVQHFVRLRARLVGQCCVQALLEIPPSHATNLSGICSHSLSGCCQVPTLVQKLQDSDPSPRPPTLSLPLQARKLPQIPR